MRNAKIWIENNVNTEIAEIAARFDISEDQAQRIAAKAKDEAEFVKIWENEDWWL